MDVEVTGSPEPPAVTRRVPWRAVVLFVVIAFVLLWAAEIPVYLTGGLVLDEVDLNPLFKPLTTIGMFAPAIAALIVAFGVLRPRHRARALGLVPVRPWPRTIAWAVVGLLLPPLLGLLALALAVLVGAVPFQTSDATLGLLLRLPVAGVIDAPFAFGEELGWRGFLLPALLPLGTAPAIVLSGVVWGLWHAPVLLLGFDYGTTSPVSLLLMSVSTVLVGTVLAWLRLRSRTVYASCFAHGALNASTGVFAAALVAPEGFDISATLLGWCGWVVLVVFIAVLVATRAFPRTSRGARPAPAA